MIRKIFYACGNHAIGYHLKQFKELSGYDVRIAAYLNDTICLDHVDWLLDSFNNPKVPRVSWYEYKVKNDVSHPGLSVLLKDLKEWKPDLAIIDHDVYCLSACRKLEIPIVLAGACHFIEQGGAEILSKQRYRKLRFNHYRDNSKNIEFTRFASSIIPNVNNYYFPYVKESKLIGTSKICAVINDPTRFDILQRIINSLNLDVEFTDEVTQNSNVVICLGDPVTVVEALRQGKYMIVLPKLSDYGQVINAATVQEYGAGVNLGQLELMQYYAPDELQNFLGKVKVPNKIQLVERIFLHERIKQYENSL